MDELGDGPQLTPKEVTITRSSELAGGLNWGRAQTNDAWYAAERAKQAKSDGYQIVLYNAAAEERRIREEQEGRRESEELKRRATARLFAAAPEAARRVREAQREVREAEGALEVARRELDGLQAARPDAAEGVRGYVRRRQELEEQITLLADLVADAREVLERTLLAARDELRRRGEAEYQRLRREDEEAQMDYEIAVAQAELERAGPRLSLQAAQAALACVTRASVEMFEEVEL